MRAALFWSTIAVGSIAAGPGSAADTLKGTYGIVGAQVCLVAPAGFKNDSKGNPTIPNGDSNLSQLTTEGRVIYHGDGTGEVRQTFVTIVPPPNPYGAAVSAGTVSYAFTYAPEGKHGYRMAVKPGTFEGMLTAGPSAGETFTIEGESRLFRVSDDRKKITVAIDKPYIQKITFSGSPTPVERICTSISNQTMLDESVDTVGQSK